MVVCFRLCVCRMDWQHYCAFGTPQLPRIRPIRVREFWDRKSNLSVDLTGTHHRQCKILKYKLWWFSVLFFFFCQQISIKDTNGSVRATLCAALLQDFTANSQHSGLFVASPQIKMTGGQWLYFYHNSISASLISVLCNFNIVKHQLLSSRRYWEMTKPKMTDSPDLAADAILPWCHSGCVAGKSTPKLCQQQSSMEASDRWNLCGWDQKESCHLTWWFIQIVPTEDKKLNLNENLCVFF